MPISAEILKQSKAQIMQGVKICDVKSRQSQLKELLKCTSICSIVSERMMEESRPSYRETGERDVYVDLRAKID